MLTFASLWRRCSAFDELDYFKLNPASFGLAGRKENELCGADYGAEFLCAKARVETKAEGQMQ